MLLQGFGWEIYMDKQDRQDLGAVRQSVFKTTPVYLGSLHEILRRMKRNDRDSGFGRVDFTNRPRSILIGVEADEAINHEGVEG